MQASFIGAGDACDWQDAVRFVLGDSATGSVVAAVGISQGADARWRVDLLAGVGHSCFKDVRCVGDVVYIGYGEQVAVLSPRTGRLTSHRLDGYFGHIFTALDLESPVLGSSVLVASASELLRFNGDGRLLWRKPELGCDGVLVERIRGDEIIGSGEWDPPGGWEPFRLKLDTGDLCGP